VFFLRIFFCDVANVANHSENNLAKFGYIPDLKVLKYSKSFDIFLATLPPELLSNKNLEILIFFFVWSKLFCQFYLVVGPHLMLKPSWDTHY